MPDRIPVGLVGYGFASRIFHAPLIDATPGLLLHTIVSSRPDAVRQDWPHIQVVKNLASLLTIPEIQLVVIATPNQTHFPLARLALQAGRHVVVDKPFTITSAEADELIQIAHDQQVMLSVFQNRRWDNDFITLCHLIAQGDLGEVLTFVSHYDRYRLTVRDRWRERDEPGAGLLYDLGAHLIDQALVLFGRPDYIWADLGRQRQGAVTDDYFHLVMRFGEKRAILHAGSLVAAPPFRFAVHGTLGSYVKQGLDPQESHLKEGKRPGDPGWGIEDPQFSGILTPAGEQSISLPSLPGAYETYYAGILATLNSGNGPPVTANEARLVMAVIEAAQVSNRDGTVTVINAGMT